MSRIITATHLGAVKGQGSVGPMQIANSPWVNVCGGEQVLVSCRGEYSDSESPKIPGWLSYFQFTVERSWFSKLLLSQNRRSELRSEVKQMLFGNCPGLTGTQAMTLGEACQFPVPVLSSVKWVACLLLVLPHLCHLS